MVRTLLVLAIGSFLNVMPVSAEERPPQITWEWYRAAEIHRNNPKAHPSQLRVAANYHRMAAEKGNPASAYKFAEMLENGIGVTQDYEKALTWYLRAAEHRDKHAYFRIGFLHQKGLGTPVNPAEAITWYQRAAKLDNEWAYHMLALMYADGEGVDRDTRKAVTYLEKSLPRTRDAYGQFRLGSLLEKQNPGRARKLLRQSAAAGNAEAARMLAEKGW